MPKINVVDDWIYDLNGLKNKSLRGLFDGDTNTGMNLNGISEDAFVVPFSSFVVLPNVYTDFQIKYYDSFGSGTTLTARMYDVNKNLLATRTLTTESFGVWKTIADIDTSFQVAFFEIYAGTINDFNSGIYEVELWGTQGAATPSIWSGASVSPVADLGKFGHGLNILDDKLETWVYGTNSSNKLVDKLGKYLRVYYESPRFDYIPDGYTGSLAAQPLWLGRFGTDHIKNRVTSQTNAGRFKASLTWLGGQGSVKDLGPVEGINTANNTAYLGGNPDKKYLDEPGADPTDPNSWDGAGELAYKLACLYGTNTGANVSGFTVLGGDGTPGQGGFECFEWGNELTFNNIDRYLSPKAMHVFLTKCYNRAKAADANLPFFFGATTYMDNYYWRAFAFYHTWNFGPSAPLPFDGICMNCYINNDLDGQGASSASVGISPEAWNLDGRLDELTTQFNTWFPNKPLRWTENGFDINSASPWEAPTIGAKSPALVAADWTLRTKAIFQKKPIAQVYVYYSYWSAGGYAFGGMAATLDTFEDFGAYSGSQVYPVGYALANELFVEENYKFRSTEILNGGTTNVHLTRKDHATDPNKKLYKIWKGTSSGSVTNNYDVNVGAGATTATLFTLRTDQFTPASQSLAITANTVTVPAVTESIRWIEVTYGSAPVENTQRTRIKKFQRVRSI